ncbi:MAG: hypothetical protein IPG29_13645 [Sphingobacteriales bacterium]|nr:hypothetical protein [Sphingobacteriales bacterium]
MTNKEKAAAFDAQKNVEKFNLHYPFGSKVFLRKIAHYSSLYAKYTVKHAAFFKNGNQTVAFSIKISGCFSVDPKFVKY